MALYKGYAYVTARVFLERDEHGRWITTYEYAGTQGAMLALINAILPGPRITYDNSGAICRVTVTWGASNQGISAFSDKWEIDRELLDLDIMFNPAFSTLSGTEKDQIRTWRQDPTVDTSTWTPLQLKVRTLISRGTEFYEAAYLVLRRTRSGPADSASSLDLSEVTSLYFTATLTANVGIPADVSGRLPNGGPNVEADQVWAWKPRLANRSFVGRGLVEEQFDWVFAAWSTILYKVR